MKVDWVPFGEVACLRREQVSVDVAKEYQEIGIRSFGRGCFIKDPLRGIDLGSKRVYWINDRDLLFSNVFAWEGAVAVASTRHDGLIGSHRFMTWECDSSRIIPEFSRDYFLSDRGLAKLNRASPGSAGRNKTLSISNLKSILVPVPTLADQSQIESHLSTLAHAAQTPNKTSPLSDGLLSALLKHTSMVDLADVLRLKSPRPLNAGEIYSIGGVYGFNRGIIHRGNISGSDTKYTRMTKIGTGDVVYSKLKAFEQAIAVALPDDEGLNFSPEFPVLTPVGASSGYLSEVFRSTQFKSQLGKLSSGIGARRERVDIAKFLSIRIPLPDKSIQDAIARLGVLDHSANALRSRRDELAAALLPAARNEIFNAMR